MIPLIGFMVGLYILMRYFEMSKSAKIIQSIFLVIFIFITIGCLFGLMIPH